VNWCYIILKMVT